jgi:mono/diheme cytochrome c family protein
MMRIAFMTALALVPVVWGCGDPITAGDDPRADSRDARRVAVGARLYAQHCAACHGARLEGQPESVRACSLRGKVWRNGPASA